MGPDFAQLAANPGRKRWRSAFRAQCPHPDQAFLQRLIDYGIATGYLGGRTVQRTSG